MRRLMAASAAMLVALSVASRAQQPTSPGFRFERPIVVDAEGPRRLAIDVPLLVGGAPFRTMSRTLDIATGRAAIVVAKGLGDLRLYDAGGREIGYLLVDNPPSAPRYKLASILPIAPVETAKEKTSGFEADLGEALLVDGFRLDAVAPPFLKRVKLEGSGDREHWTLLVAEGTLFDLPDERLRQTELRFTPGSYRYLRLIWDDAKSGRVSPPAAAAARQVVPVTTPPPLTAPLTFERRPSEPGRSRFRVRLPGAHLPIVALDLDVAPGYLLREATVLEARLSGSGVAPVPLGQSTLRRVVRGDLSASSLRIPIEPPSEAQLDLDVDDGANPPLDLKGVTAAFADLPWIYFDAPAGTLTARYGNHALTAPHYDIEAARPQIAINTVATAAWGEPRLGAVVENASVAAPQMPTVGSVLDPTLFKYVRTIPSGDAQLVAVSLDAAVLSHTGGGSGGFADLRVIDGEGRQVPYLVERVSEPLSLDLEMERLATPPKTMPPSRSARSIYRVKLPFPDLPSSRLVLPTTARVFVRAITVAVERDAGERRRDPGVEPIVSAQWRHADQENAALPLTLGLPAMHATDFLVIVDEGDNAPLPIGRAQLLLPSYRLRLFRPGATSLRVAYGRTDLGHPQYDLALLGPQVMGASALDVTLGAEQGNASANPNAVLVSPRLFWAALGLAAVVLVGLIARLVKKQLP